MGYVSSLQGRFYYVLPGYFWWGSWTKKFTMNTLDDLGLPNFLEAPPNDESSSCHPWTCHSKLYTNIYIYIDTHNTYIILHETYFFQVCMGGPSGGRGNRNVEGALSTSTQKHTLTMDACAAVWPGQFTNGFPLWRRAGMGAAMWLYSGNKGLLVIRMSSGVKCFKWINSWSRIKKIIRSWFGRFL